MDYPSQQKYFGKYRGLVEKVDDPENLGRIKARIPEVLENEVSPWCWPCSPFAGPKYGWVSLPKQGDGVWIEFEAGDISRPIWTGFWWAQKEIPESGNREIRGWWTPQGHQISIDDNANELTLRIAQGAEIQMTQNKITFSVSGQTLTVDGSGFDFNNGALNIL